MNDDYLWDGSGEPDPEIARLEGLLARFRHNRPAPEFPEPRSRRAWLRSYWPAWALPVAAAIALAAWFAFRVSLQSGWSLATLAGAPQLGGVAVPHGGRLAVGATLATNAVSRARLEVDGLGEIEVEPNTRLRLLQATKDSQQIALERGTISAQITAPPYVFLVRTPSAYALDMGCAYTLEVRDDGSSLLRVTFGWVQFQHWGVQSLVPAGAAAETRPGYGPGAPYFEDASPEFRQALETVNFAFTHPAARASALSILLQQARPKDAYTLLNLFRRVSPDDRGRLFDRLAQLIPPPPGATREGAIAGDPAALDPWWNVVGVGHPKKGKKRIPVVDE